MESKHTLGPWEAICVDLRHKDAIDGKWYIFHIFPSGYTEPVCELPTNQSYAGGVPHPETRRANARLIAAAPDLLEVLEAILWKLNRKEDIDGTIRWAKIDSRDAVIRRAFEAVAKARKGWIKWKS